MTNMAYLAMISQAFTLLLRGQQSRKPIIWPQYYLEFYIMVILMTVVHVGIMIWRAGLRGCWISNTLTAVLAGIDCTLDDDDNSGGNNHNPQYSDLHYLVWIWLLVGSMMNVIVGFVVNHDDNHHYRRYLQFLRLEFDTRLGMHSPR